jgi:hypothetical protein
MAIHVAPLLLRSVVKKLPKLLRKTLKRKLRNRRRKQEDGKKKRWKRVLIAVVVLIPFVWPAFLLLFILSVWQSTTAVQGAAAQNVAAVSACGGAGLHAAAPPASGGQPQSGVISPAQIAQYAAAAGFTGEDLVIAVAVALAESGGRVDADNTGLNRDGSTDYGLWQINSVHRASGFDPSRAFDPSYNAAWAQTVFSNAGASWTPWTTYKSGAYRQHLDVAREATGISPPNESAGEQPVSPITCAPPMSMMTQGFPAEIDPYQPYVPQTTCSPAPKPGVVEFADMLMTTYPATGSSGIARTCGIGGRSEHKEGRAFDWTARVNDPTERAAAESAIDWLLATDEHGNQHAMFRRFGLMYIIWNRQIFSSSSHAEGWRPYPCSLGASSDECHVGHVHFSFSWAGAMRKTSWWTAPREAPSAAPGGATAQEQM